MATYEFHCNKCGERFVVEETVSQHQQHKEKCPKCRSRDIAQEMSPIFAKTSKKS